MPYRSAYFHWGVALFAEGHLRLSFTEHEPAGAGRGSRISRRIRQRIELFADGNISAVTFALLRASALRH